MSHHLDSDNIDCIIKIAEVYEEIFERMGHNNNLLQSYIFYRKAFMIDDENEPVIEHKNRLAKLLDEKLVNYEQWWDDMIGQPKEIGRHLIKNVFDQVNFKIW